MSKLATMLTPLLREDMSHHPALRIKQMSHQIDESCITLYENLYETGQDNCILSDSLGERKIERGGD